MDPLTHGLAGALAAQGLTRHRKIRPTLITGFFAALLADLDTLIRSSADPLFTLEMHRQFTHSLVFIPVGALIATLLMFWFQRQHLSIVEVYIISLAGFATSGLLDAFTSYGTQLLWPFSDLRIAWNLLPIIDPLVTGGLLYAFYRLFRKERHIMGPPKGSTWAYIGLGWMGLLILIGYVQHQRARSVAYDIARERGHIIEQMTVKPTLGNRVLWRSTYISKDTVYADGIRLAWISDNITYDGERSPLVDPIRYTVYEGSTMYLDIQRFHRLSKGYLVYHPDQPDVLGDARYAMLPTSLSPLWGIRIDESEPGEHAQVEYFREAGEDVRRPLTRMLRGRPAEVP
ncbi:MAG: inner membrane protein [Bacteroidetes bacterium HLUCCA01]|nr:MAG: inner membrane protein [Bacteroidetes bacterium HLUCCA01]